MKKLARISTIMLVTSQIAGAAHAAEVDRHASFVDTGRGAFAGIRLQVPLGGSGSEERMRASLAVAPTAYSRVGPRLQSAMADGLELALSPGGKPELRLSGQRLDEVTLLVKPREKDRANMSDVAKVAIVAGVVLVLGAAAFVHVMNEASCFHGGSSGDC